MPLAPGGGEARVARVVATCPAEFIQYTPSTVSNVPYRMPHTKHRSGDVHLVLTEVLDVLVLFNWRWQVECVRNDRV